MSHVHWSRLGMTIALCALVAACGDKSDGNSLAALDAQLTNNVTDPALREAVESPIAVDPDLTTQSNRHAVRPADKPLNGAVPTELGVKPAAAQIEQAAGGKIMPAPTATRTSNDHMPMTLGALAKEQQSGGTRRSGSCGSPRVTYDMAWAQRLPAAFPLFPGANLTEAAGANNGPCAIRAVSFTTKAPVQDVINFYYTTARRANFSAERQIRDGQEVLGGTRDSDGTAYFITFEAMRGGGTSVDLIANGGR